MFTNKICFLRCNMLELLGHDIKINKKSRLKRRDLLRNVM
jgi:hypothetical protein